MQIINNKGNKVDVPQSVHFNGTKYTLLGKKRYYLSSSTINKGRKNPKGLHVAIWEFYNKKTIQKGFVIHHKDGDWFNNDIDNLECLSRKQHAQEHIQEFTKEKREHLARIRELTKVWHASEEGREWHRQNGKNAWKNKIIIESSNLVEYRPSNS